MSQLDPKNPLIKQHATLNTLDYYSKGAKPIKEENFITLGFQNKLAVVEQVPVITIGTLKTKLSGQLNVLKPISYLPAAKSKFINLNGKKLLVVPPEKIPDKVKNMVKINAPFANPKVLPNKALLPVKMFKSADKHVKQTVTDKGKGNEIKPNIVNSPVIHVQTITEASDSHQYKLVQSPVQEYCELADLHLLPAVFGRGKKLLNSRNLKVLNKMQALNLSMKKDQQVEPQQEKAIQTNVNLLVDKEVQTDPTPKPSMNNFDSYDFLSMFENSNDSPIIRDVNIGTGPNIGKVSYVDNNVFPSGFSLAGGKEIVLSETKRKQLMFFTDLRECLNYNAEGNLPIHEGVIDANVHLVQRNCVALKARKADVNVENHNGCTPLQLAIINNSTVPIVRILLDFNADITEADGDGNNILHLCAKFGRLQILETILEHVSFKNNANCINSFNFEGVTPLMICCISSCTQGAKLLIKYGSDVNIRDQTSGRTALFHAAEAQNVAIVSMLLDHKADPKIKNFFGTSPHDAMYELEDMSEKVKSLIFGRSKKRSLEAEMNPTRTAKAVKTIKTYPKLKKIEPKLMPQEPHRTYVRSTMKVK
ncbi:uncharacterized protein LOC126748810 [Anthonomus grandis grandis]|uniref:uncharacterized protein LOC126748810 n=1 Tax=Anthonomus grandis grandis TaxID=2921223 RepID=UPI002166A987|nr:uncharacterized protein LOC126748810 [Anthonomus grandis grandis]